MHINKFTQIFCLMFALLTASAISGCDYVPNTRSDARNEKLPKDTIYTTVELGIMSYNYTDKIIDVLSIGPVSAGNVRLSTETSGGGGIACCFSYSPGVGPDRVEVRWSDDRCIYDVKVFEDGQSVYKFHRKELRRWVDIAMPIPDDPKYLEVHFNTDGTIQAALSKTISPPKVRLSGSRGKPLPNCPDNVKPT